MESNGKIQSNRKSGNSHRVEEIRKSCFSFSIFHLSFSISIVIAKIILMKHEIQRKQGAIHSLCEDNHKILNLFGVKIFVFFQIYMKR